jgi:hypothetical protein
MDRVGRKRIYHIFHAQHIASMRKRQAYTANLLNIIPRERSKQKPFFCDVF